MMDRRRFLKGAAALAALAILPIELNAANPPVLEPGESLFGDGRDGNLTLSAGNVVELTRDMYFRNLDLTRGGQIVTNGYRIHCSGLLIVPQEDLGYPLIIFQKQGATLDVRN